MSLKGRHVSMQDEAHDNDVMGSMKCVQWVDHVIHSGAMGNWSSSVATCPLCGEEVRWRRGNSVVQVKCFKGGVEGGCGWSEDIPDWNEARLRQFIAPPSTNDERGYFEPPTVK